MNFTGNRKFIIICFVQVIAAVALFIKTITGQEWITAVSISLTLYFGANVVNSKMPNRKE